MVTGSPGSYAGLRLDPAGLDRPLDHLEVALDLVGVGLREVGDGEVDAVALAQVGRDAMRSPERACPRASVQPQTPA